MNLLMKGAEPFYYSGNKTGCLLIHGFTASPQEMRGLGQHLASQGYTVLGIRLFGHGTAVEDMNRARWRDWLANAEDGYHMLSTSCSRIFLLGFSTGGALSFLLAEDLPVNGIVSMSTLYKLPPDPRLRLLRPFLRPLSSAIPFIQKAQSEWWDPEAAKKRVAYSAYPVRGVIELDYLLKKLRAYLPLITVPTLLMHSINDGFIPAEHMALIAQNLGSPDKETMLVEKSNHIITCDAERQKVYQAASGFIARMECEVA